ncbi:hypothetical protein [Brucella tritici]|uniref:hypothetical protein n=1 Tax=Brucella tritici TaxID=94626 RepID=UPI00200082E0|nr:hypothetical protein [Brucella tritici]
MLEQWVNNWQSGIKSRIQSNNTADIENRIANLIAYSKMTPEIISAGNDLRSKLNPLQLEPALQALEVLATQAKAAGPNDLAKALGY